MNNQLIVTYGLLSGMIENSKSFFSYYVPFIVDCVSKDTEEQVHPEVIQHRLKNKRGMELEIAVLNRIIKEAVKGGYFRNENGSFYSNPLKCKTIDLQNKSRNLQRKYTQILEAFIKFSNSRGYKSDEIEANKVFNDFLASYSIPIHLQIAKSQEIDLKVEFGRERFLMYEFIQDIYQKDQHLFECFVEFIKGSMLNTVAYRDPDSKMDKNRFRNVEIYLDTSPLLRLLGYEGAALQKPFLESISLLREFGCKICCFEHTYDETTNVLYENQSNFTKLKTSDLSPGKVGYYWASNNYSSDKVSAEIQSFPIRMKKFDIGVNPAPKIEKEHTLNFEMLEKLMNQIIGYRIQDSLNRDLKSLGSIHALRGGKRPLLIRYSKAIFLTDNPRLVKASIIYFTRDMNYSLDSSIHVCYDWSDFTSQVWLRKPLQKPDLPALQLMADCHAAMDPSAEAWKKYEQIATEMHKEGSMTEEECVRVLFSKEFKQVALEMEKGISNVNPKSRIDQIKRKYDGTTESELRYKIEELEKEKKEREIKDTIIDKNMTKTRKKAAKNDKVRLQLIITFLVLVFNGLAFYIIEYHPNSSISFLGVILHAALTFISTLTLTSVLPFSIIRNFYSRYEQNRNNFRYNRYFHKK